MAQAMQSVKKKNKTAFQLWMVLFPMHSGSSSASQMAATQLRQKHERRPRTSRNCAHRHRKRKKK
jgi:hypothetical protein